MTDHRGPIPVPARITLALDSIGAEGPWVDEALGGAEPMVDEWEAGERVPTRRQIELLAQLTEFPPEFFYKPVEPWEHEPMTIFMCQMGRRGDNGLTIVRSHVDWAGVLQVEELTPPRPPYRPRKAKVSPAAAGDLATRTGEAPNAGKPHRPQEEPGAPGWCKCGMPYAHRSHRGR